MSEDVRTTIEKIKELVNKQKGVKEEEEVPFSDIFGFGNDLFKDIFKK